MAEQAGCGTDELVDFSASINPLGPPDWFRSVVSAELSDLVHYPDPHCTDLKQAAANKFSIAPEEIVAGNGSTEILYALVRALGISRAIVPVPAYTDYRRACELGGAEVIPFALREADSFAVDFDALEHALKGCEAKGIAVFLGQPNNPTGKTVPPDRLRDFAARHPRTWVIVDEAFADFLPELDRLATHRPDNVIVLHSLTKFYAVPGLRLGLAYAASEVADTIARTIPPWSVNGVAQAVGARALSDDDYARRTIAQTVRLRDQLAGRLAELPGVTAMPGEANFILCRMEQGAPTAPELAGRLLHRGIAIRVCDTFEGLGERYFRVAVKNDADNVRLIRAMRSALASQTRVTAPKRTPAIMLQGTASNAGKSVLAAAVCRILLQDGVDVAPFKSQNMALNSFVTRDGGEMGRAQVTQAAACRLSPDVRMNPVLLKPSSDTGSQVIVMGKPVGQMRVAEYINYKETAFATARQAYDDLAAEHQVMVLEGAGSPAEINLKRHDIVNMNMARHAGANVLLAGDIDRGGVFASFVGTMEMLEEWERDLVSGFVINRFRGDASLLHEALEYTSFRTQRPFYGVVPYLESLGLPEEDSVSFKAGGGGTRPSAERVVDVAVVDFPHISNFTDIDPLLAEPDVMVRIVSRPDELGSPDAVVLPGSKNVIADMRWLRDSGMGGAVASLAAGGSCECIGICGGLQMLGKTIADPHNIESGGMQEGLGLLDVRTELGEEKHLVRTEGRHTASGHALTGYEIHHGVTTACGDGAVPSVVTGNGVAVGWSDCTGMIWGSYLHGVFDADVYRRWFVDCLRQRAGHAPIGRVVAAYDLEPALDRLAGAVRQALDLSALYKAIGL